MAGAIFLETGTGITVKGNTVTGAVNAGIGVRNSNRNTITGNMVTNCGKGLNIEGTSTGNAIYFNDFNNGYSVSGVTNTFNSPSAQTFTYQGKAWSGILGNRWANYVSTDLNGNGLGDKVYTGNGFKDNYPLMASIANFAIGGSATPTPEPHGNPGADGNSGAYGNPRPTVTPAPTATPTADAEPDGNANSE